LSEELKGNKEVSHVGTWGGTGLSKRKSKNEMILMRMHQR
jgi:hypothetical protein